MDLGIGGRVAVVGGSSKGIGKGIAHALVREQANVTICARHEQELELARQDLCAATPEARVLAVQADLSSADGVSRVVERTLERWGRIDIVVNNVGGPPPGQAAGFSDQQWLSAFELNFFSLVRMCREVLPVMRQRRWGRIINVLALSVRQIEENLALSTVTRTAAAAYAKNLADEVAPDEITVNNILPSSVETERLQMVMEMQARHRGLDAADARKERLARVPVGRFGRPDEIAALACFLASEHAGFITGTTLLFDGGTLRATI
jgi:3-oxoacyl-[acyl-carrier protein] reductase